MIDADHFDEGFHENRGAEEDEDVASAPRWRRPVLVTVAALTALAMAILPLYNVIFGPSVADSGLEICGFDYCIVQEAVREAGAGEAMSRLSNVFLDEAGARDLADRLTDHLDIEGIEVVVVQDLEGRLGGVYDPETRMISIESPARAWTVLHEVAHAVETGHGEPFQDVVIDLAIWLDAARA